MVFLHKKKQIPPRKTPSSSSFIPPLHSSSSKNPNKATAATRSITTAETSAESKGGEKTEENVKEKMTLILAEAGCTLINPSGPPCLPSDTSKFRRHLQNLFSPPRNAPSNNSLRSDFLSGFSSYVSSPLNLRRVLTASTREGFGSASRESLVRNLLLVPSIQLHIQIMLLEKLPEYFDVNPEHSGSSLSLEHDVARLIINHFRWLDFVVDPDAFIDKLMQVISICPINLKKEIIGSLPEIIGDQNSKTVVDFLEPMLQEDSAIIVPVLDAFSNLNLNDQLEEQVITIALSCIRTIDADDISYLLRFLLISASPVNARRIISKIREHLKFVMVSHFPASQQKFKGKSPVNNTTASILDALRSSLQFKSMLCQEILKELNSLERPRDHKLIDIWLLMLIYMNGESLQRNVEKIFKKKIMEDCIQDLFLDQCIHENRQLVQDYFTSFISLSEYLLTCKEQKAREFGLQIYIQLFEEFPDTYSRQEILGALVAHVGSGVGFEVSSALETMNLLASKHAHELIPLSYHINGILDYLEGFRVEDLHKVYEVFSHLALSARSDADSNGPSIANELMMVVRKQVSHPELKYKKMGLIGTLKMVSCLGDVNTITRSSSSLKSNSEEAVELVKTAMESCKQFPLALILLYDELGVILESKTVHPEMVEWIGKHVGEFETMFLSDLEGGHLPVKETCCDLEGELWMNLDGEISPICINILSLASSLMQSASLQILPVNFLLLSTIERLTNQGSLGGIDALLGCPLHLPSSKYFSGAAWKSLTGKQKHIVCLCLYYAANWIRELLNAFCTQVVGRSQCVSQSTKEDIISKLLMRLRNLVFIEGLLSNYVEQCSISLPALHLYMEHFGSSILNQPTSLGGIEKIDGHKRMHENTSPIKRKRSKSSKTSLSSETNGKLRQPTILDVLRKGGAEISQEVLNEVPSGPSSNGSNSQPKDKFPADADVPVTIQISSISSALEAQRFKFRPLLAECLSILTFSKNEDSCCSDPAGELPLYLYLLRDLHCKLDCFTSPCKPFMCRRLDISGFIGMTTLEFFGMIRPLFPCLKRVFDSSVCILTKGDSRDRTCQEHWTIKSASAKNPNIPNVELSESAVSVMALKEIFYCFNKMLNLSAVQTEKSLLSGLLEAFSPTITPDNMVSGIQPKLIPGTIGYLYLGAYSFVEDVLDTACSFSFMLGSESLFTLESIVSSVQRFVETLEGHSALHVELTEGVLPNIRTRFGTSAQKFLWQNWNKDHFGFGCKSKGDIVQKVLRIYFENFGSTSDLLDELAMSILPQVSSSRNSEEDDNHGFPTLCSATFNVWYRELHEVNLAALQKLVKEVVLLEKSTASVQLEKAENVLLRLQKSVNVVVSLVNMCRTHDKVTVHAMAVKYGGRYVDSFLKVFEFLERHIQKLNELIISLVTELQKATRTIQVLCSEAKGLKQTNITSKIPATKRSLERFLFRVKGLLHMNTNGCTFWMGNLKHKDMAGQVVSSQAYIDEPNENPPEAVDEDRLASEEDRET